VKLPSSSAFPGVPIEPSSVPNYLKEKCRAHWAQIVNLVAYRHTCKLAVLYGLRDCPDNPGAYQITSTKEFCAADMTLSLNLVSSPRASIDREDRKRRVTNLHILLSSSSRMDCGSGSLGRIGG
jgi:hypothetical protein